MKCNYIALTIDQENFDTFIRYLGKRCNVEPEDLKYIDLSKNLPITPEVWDIIDKGDYVIIDARKINMMLSIILYTRFIKWPQRTFIILNPEDEDEFDWGLGTAFCKLHMEEGEQEKKLSKLQRDIAFYFSLENESSNEDPSEVVRQFLERYWKQGDDKRFSLDFSQIEALENNIGEAIVGRLKEHLESNDIDNFKEELKNIEGNKNIDFTDYVEISHLCKEAGLKRYRVSIMEQGYNDWNNIPQLFFELVDSYIDSPNRSDRVKALEMIEDYFGIVYDEEKKPSLKSLDSQFTIEENHIKILFNAYISLGKFDTLYQLSKLEEQFAIKAKGENLHSLFVRNEAICLREQGKSKEALALFKELYSQEPSENTLGLIAVTNANIGRHVVAIRLYTALSLVDYGGKEQIFRLAEFAWGRLLFFDIKVGWSDRNTIKRNTRRQIVPLIFFLFSFEANQNDIDLIYVTQRFLDMINDTDALTFWNKNKSVIDYLWENFKDQNALQMYDFTLVDYLQDKHKEFQTDDQKLEGYIQDILDSIYEESGNGVRC